MKFFRFGVPVAALVMLAAAGCSGGSGTAPSPIVTPGISPTGAPVTSQASAVFSISIPYASAPSSARRRPAYISPSTMSLAISVGTAAPQTIDLTPTSPACTTPTNGTLTCTETVIVPGGTTQTFVVKSYDGLDGTGDVLSDATVLQAITAGIANNVPLTLNGDVAQVAITAAAVPACVATTVPIVVTAEDAKNNVIVGPFSNPITLTDSNTTNTTISNTKIAKPSDTSNLTYDGKSPGYAVISAAAPNLSPAKVTPLVVPLPKVCNEYDIIGTVQPANPREIAAGSDGNLYAAEYETGALAEIAPAAAAGTVPTQVQLAATGGLTYKLEGITTGSDKNLWITDQNIGVDVVTPGTTASVTPTSYADATEEQNNGIVAGPDNNLWSAATAGFVSKITTAGVFTDYPVPSGSSSRPFGIASGADGRLWFTETNGNRIGAITTAGVVTEYATLPTASAIPEFITPGPGLSAGAAPGLWFGEAGAGQLGFITTGGSVTEIPIPVTATTNQATPVGIVTGLDGNIYFADPGNDRFGQYAPLTGGFQFFAPPAQSNQVANSPKVYALALGPDGNIYFTDSSVTDDTTYTGALGYFAY